MKGQTYYYILKDIPLFAHLSARELDYIKRHCSFVEYKKNQIIYKEASAASFFYCIIRGRVAISTQDRYGKQTVLEHLYRGRYFGVISSLTHEPHSVTARAINDSLLLAIPQQDFERILKKIPSLALDLTKTLSRRLKHKDLHQKIIFESTIIAVMSSLPRSGKTLYAGNLALSISKEAHKRVIILDICPPDLIHTLPQVLKTPQASRIFNLSSRIQSPQQIKEYILKDSFGIDLAYLIYSKNDHLFWQKSVLEILSLLVNDYHYIILDLPSVEQKDFLDILNQADIIHLLTSTLRQDMKATKNLIRELDKVFSFPVSKIKVILNEKKTVRLSPQIRTQLIGHDIFADLPPFEPGFSGRIVVEHPETKYAKVIRRIARQEADCLVGLALGVGAAYGFCHIGVLKVIEQEKIPIDIISGSSIGAVVASLWATGYSSAQILDICQEFREPKYIWNLLDFTLPFQGLIKGDKLYNFLKRYLGRKTFYDVKIPVKIIASDVKNKQIKILDKGLLLDAIMASCAMPGVFTPFKVKHELLFDGGVISPLPTEPLFELGIKKIIAVNVTPSKQDMQRKYRSAKDNIEVEHNKKVHPFWSDLKDYFKQKFKTNILDFIFSSFEIMQSEVAQKESEIADVVIHPDLSGLHWLELHRAQEFAKRGEEQTRKQLDKIKQLVG